MIILKKLRYQNFMSVGNNFIEFNLNEFKTTLLVGKNGSGKSGILEALCFVLYGKPFRNINKPQLINSITGKNLLIELEFSSDNNEYLIRRGIKPAIFEIFKNGELIDQRAESKDYQKLIDQTIMKISYKAFCQRVILGSANFVPFMQLTAAARREFIEDLLDIQIFSTMNTLLKDKIQDNKNQLTKIDYQIESTNKLIEINKKHKNQLKSQSKKTIDDNNKQIEELLLKNKQYNESNQLSSIMISDLNAEYSKVRDLELKMSKVTKASTKLQHTMDEYTNEIDFYSSSSQCSQCNQEIAEDFKTKKVLELNSSLEETKTAYQKLELLYSKMLNSLNQFEKLNQKIKQLNDQLIENNNAVAINNKIVANLQNHNKQVEKIEIIDETTHIEQLKLLEGEKRKLLEERELNSVASMLLKDDGIKTKILKQYMPIINNSINRYLDQMGFFCKFEIDENFNESIKSRYRDEFSYASFSEGEKTRIDLALLFTWREIAKCRNSASINLLILDEIMDSSLDASGTDEFVNIIKQLSDQNNIFVISHKIDNTLDKFDRVIQFQKHQNFTQLI